MNIEEQVVSIFLGVRGYLDGMPVAKVRAFEKFVLDRMKKEASDLLAKIRKDGQISPETENSLKNSVEKYLQDFLKEQQKAQ